jgi:hypothetical protein
MIALVFGLVLLHSAGGHDIYLNPKTVTTMRAATPGKPNKLITDDAKCVLNTSDGKFISVVETCDEARKMMEQVK